MAETEEAPVSGLALEPSLILHQQFKAREFSHEIAAAAGRLLRPDADPLLAELKGMPQEAIARHLGSNRNAIYKLTHDARKNLKKGLEAAGYTAEDVVATTAK